MGAVPMEAPCVGCASCPADFISLAFGEARALPPRAFRARHFRALLSIPTANKLALGCSGGVVKTSPEDEPAMEAMSCRLIGGVTCEGIPLAEDEGCIGEGSAGVGGLGAGGGATVEGW
mmetsp:Transcript_17294/g.39525  ORF Transcript_17294/g.39525 Transcript_17294/m.39525 type:complete len:119 (-) Transcript_17294:241-597(-)